MNINDDDKVNRLDELLPQLNQLEKISVISQITFCLQGAGGEPTGEIEQEFLEIFDELEDDRNIISVVQSLANSLVK